MRLGLFMSPIHRSMQRLPANQTALHGLSCPGCRNVWCHGGPSKPRQDRIFGEAQAFGNVDEVEELISQVRRQALPEPLQRRGDG